MRASLLPITTGVVVLLAFVFLNFDGQPLHVVRFPLKSRNPNLSSLESYKVVRRRAFNTGEGNWIHGWPFGGLLRIGIYQVGHRGEPSPQSFSGPYGSYSRWPFDDSPWNHINPYVLLINAVIAFVAVGDAYVSMKAFVTNQFRFSIRLLLRAAFIVAMLVSLRRYIVDVHDPFEAWP